MAQTQKIYLGNDEIQITKFGEHGNIIRAAFIANPLVFDLYPGAAAGYSLRKLRASYAGSAIEVTRTSDSATQDIGFDVSGNLDTSALTTFIGANTGVVSKWYDQSGNNQHMTQSTQANMATIVSSGTLITQGGKPAVRFDGSNDSYVSSISTNPFSFTGGVSIVHATYKNATAYKDYESIISAGATGNSATNQEKMLGVNFGNSPNYSPRPTIATDIWRPSGVQYDGSVSTNSRMLVGVYISNWSTHRSTGFSNMRLNGSDLTTKTYNVYNPSSLNTNAMRLGVYDTILASSFFAGDIQEVLVWASDENSNRTGIEGNVNDYYSIY